MNFVCICIWLEFILSTFIYENNFLIYWTLSDHILSYTSNSFLSWRVFGLLSSSLLLLLFPQSFGRYTPRPSSGVCRTREPSRNFELRPLLNPLGSPVLIPLAITWFKYSCIVTRLQSRLNMQLPGDCFLRSWGNQRL